MARLGFPKPPPREKAPTPLRRKAPMTRTKPVSTRRSPYQHPEWRKLTAAVRKRSRGICELCGTRPATGDAHHLSYGPGRGWRRLVVPMDQLVAVCRPCHLEQHR